MLRRSVTRDAVGQRLRINGALLFGFYIASRSTRYANAAAHLLALLPALDAPLHWLGESSRNDGEQRIYSRFPTRIRCAPPPLLQHPRSPLPTQRPLHHPPTPTSLPQHPLAPDRLPSSLIPQGQSPCSSLYTALTVLPQQTRPSPSPTATRSLVKSESPLKSVSPLRLSSPSLRHSTTPAASTPNRRRSLLSTSTSTPLPSSLVTPIKHDESPQQPILTAFMVRHSPVACQSYRSPPSDSFAYDSFATATFHRSISDRQSIDSLFEPRASM